MPARRINAFKPVIEEIPMYPDMSTAEIRRNVQRMRDKANMSIERTQKSGYYSQALENRKEYLRSQGQLRYKNEYFRSRGYDLKFKAGKRLNNPEMERARLIKESKELTKFLNNSTRNVSGIKSALEKMKEHPVFEMLSEGMTSKEMSSKFSKLFDMADDIKKKYEEHGIDPSSFDKYEAIEDLIDSIVSPEQAALMSTGEKSALTREILNSMSQAERDQLINSFVQKIADTHYASINAKFAEMDAKLEAMEREFRGF